MDPQAETAKTEKIVGIKMLEEPIPAVLIIHSFSEFKVEYMSERRLNILGVTPDEIQKLGSNYLSRFFNPEHAHYYIRENAGLLACKDSKTLE